MDIDHISGHPISEIIESDRHIRIYANGVVEGCDPVRIVNHLPLVVNREWFDYFSKSHEAELPYDNPKFCNSLPIGAGHSIAPQDAKMSGQRETAAGEK